MTRLESAVVAERAQQLDDLLRVPPGLPCSCLNSEPVSFLTDFHVHETPATEFDRSSDDLIAVTNGKLDFGPWEQVFYGEFDGRRAKRVLIKVIGE
jgi:hypothetical protein